MSERLTGPMRQVLQEMGDGPSLRNGDEGSPQWWIEGGRAVHKRTGERLVRDGLVTLIRRWGGHPGVLGFAVSDAGRAALGEKEG